MALQDGIYWDIGARPGKHFSMVLLRIRPGAAAAEIGSALGAVWRCCAELGRGIAPRLGAEAPVPAGELSVLVGYGPDVFAAPGVTAAAPEALGPHQQFLAPRPGGHSRLLYGSGLRYATDVEVNPGGQGVCLQFIANSELAVHRAVVESGLAISSAAPAGAPPALSIAAVLGGFQRDDRRSWIDFHDGLSNLESGAERWQTIAVKPETAGADAWTVGGTYLAFLRIAIDLEVWRTLSLRGQEALIGRTRGTGELLPHAVDSHVQRVNHHRLPVERVDSRRLYRQGYDFFEPSAAPPGFRVGLNFVSFQDDPARLLHILTQPGWMGGVSFGGPDGAATPDFLSVRAAGVFWVPPAASGEPFPGAALLGVT